MQVTRRLLIPRFLLSFFLLLYSLACTPTGQGAQAASQAQLVSTLGQLESKLRQQTDVAKMDTADIRRFTEHAKALAERFPQDSLAPLYLFRAAELQQAQGQWELAIDIWGQVANRFSSYQRSAEARFMQGFVAENNLQDRKRAVRYYQDFIEAYPQHPLKKDAEVLIENLKKNVSDQELIEQFEQQQQ